MQKRLMIAVLLALAILPVSAAGINITLLGDVFHPGQTVQAKVVMDRFTVAKISLLGSSGNKLGASFFSQPYEGGYFVYFLFSPSLAAGNYSLFVSDTFVEGGALQHANATAPFAVKKDAAVFAVSPAIVILSSKTGSFSIDLRHTYGAGSLVNVSSSLSLHPVRDSIAVSPGESKSLYVDYNNLTEDASLMLKSGNISYTIPVVAVKEAVPEPEENVSEEPSIPSFENALRVVGNISSISRKVKQNVVIAGPVSIKNVNSLALHNVLFSASGVPGVEFSSANIPILMPEEVFTQQITINRVRDAEPGKYSGKITAESDEGASLSIDIMVEFEVVEVPAEPAEIKNVSEAPAALNMGFNSNEAAPKGDDERVKSLGIAVALIIAVVALAVLIILKIRPKVKYRKMQEYAKGRK